MIATYVPPKKTPCTARELAQAYELALGGDGNVSANLIAVLLAHCTLECGRDVKAGLIATSCYHYNLGNIKASATYEGLYTCIRLNEYLTIGGVRGLYWFSPEGAEQGGTAAKRGSIAVPCTVPEGHPQTRMRALRSLREGVESKIRFLSAPRFGAAMSFARAGNAAGYSRALHDQKYYTANEPQYTAGIVSLTATMMPVAQRIADEPIGLSSAEEQHIDEAIRVYDRTIPEHVASVQFDLTQTIDWNDRS